MLTGEFSLNVGTHVQHGSVCINFAGYLLVLEDRLSEIILSRKLKRTHFAAFVHLHLQRRCLQPAHSLLWVALQTPSVPAGDALQTPSRSAGDQFAHAAMNPPRHHTAIHHLTDRTNDLATVEDSGTSEHTVATGRLLRAGDRARRSAVADRALKLRLLLCQTFKLRLLRCRKPQVGRARAALEADRSAIELSSSPACT